jgi:hypothetical protein
MTMEMIALTKKGDTKNTWDTSNPEECEQAEALFDTYRSGGFSAFVVGEGGNTSITQFDPEVGTIMFVPMLSGG